MRFFYSILLTMCLAGPAWADGMIISTSGPVYTDCSQLGSHAFYWNGDHASGTTYGCKSGGTINGTLSGATVVVSTTEPGVASPASAGNILDLAASNNRLRFTITAKNIFDSSEGQFCADIYLSGSTGDNIGFNAPVDASNGLVVTINSANQVYLSHKGNANQVTVTSTDTVSDTTWTNICARWSVTNNKVSVKVGNGSWKDDSDADVVTAFTAEPATFDLAGSTVTNEFYMDNATTDTVSGI